MAIVQLWLDHQAVLGIDGHSPVFITLKGKAVKSAYIRTLLPRLPHKAGIDGGYHPHGLRHTHAFELPVKGRRCTSFNASQAMRPLRPPTVTSSISNPSAVVEAMKSRVWTL